MKATLDQPVVGKDGRLTYDGLALLQAYERRIAAIEARLAGLAEIDEPTGGTTVDAEARTAIAAILAV